MTPARLPKFPIPPRPAPSPGDYHPSWKNHWDRLCCILTHRSPETAPAPQGDLGPLVSRGQGWGSGGTSPSPAPGMAPWGLFPAEQRGQTWGHSAPILLLASLGPPGAGRDLSALASCAWTPLGSHKLLCRSVLTFQGYSLGKATSAPPSPGAEEFLLLPARAQQQELLPNPLRAPGVFIRHTGVS